jgi:hypothetical protein
MAGRARGLAFIDELPGATYQVLVPKEKGLESILSLLAAYLDKPPVSVVAVFTAATDTLLMANVNITVADSVKRLEHVQCLRCPRRKH